MKKIVAILLAVAMLLALAACGQTAAPETPEDPAEEATEAPATEAPATEAPEEDAETGEPTKMDEIREAGVWCWAPPPTTPPYEFHTKIDGEDTIVGFDIRHCPVLCRQPGGRAGDRGHVLYQPAHRPGQRGL